MKTLGDGLNNFNESLRYTKENIIWWLGVGICLNFEVIESTKAESTVDPQGCSCCGYPRHLCVYSF